MPKFLAGCHYNEEEISQHLRKKYRILAGPNEWQKVCNRSNPEKAVEVVKGQILAGGAQKSPEPCSLSLHPEETSNATQEYRHLLGTLDLAKLKINDTGAWN